MANAVPVSLEILTCFILSITLLNRYSDMVNNNIITVVGVFVSWFFSFMVIFLLPADLTSTAYRQCVLDYQASINSTTTTTPSPVSHMVSPAPTMAFQNSNLSTFYSNSTSLHLDSTILANNSTDIVNPCIMPWNYVSDNVLTKLWRFIYWTSQFLTWLLLPIMQSYSMAGDFTTTDKLKSAIRANFIYYSSFGAIFVVLLIYVIFKNGFDFANLKVIIISASNTWGLFLLVVLLGYGLVELPRFLINRSKYTQSMNQLYFRVARVNSEKCEAEEKLDDVLEEIHQAFNAIGTNENSPLKKYLTKIVDKCPPDWKRRSNAFRRQAAASTTIYEPDRSKVQTHDTQSMIKLHRKVIKAVHYHRQITCKWNHLIREVIEWEDVARNQMENLGPISSRMFKSTLPKERTIMHSLYTPKVEWFWKCLVRVWVLRISGFVMAALSLAVVWSEIAFPMSIVSTKLSVFAYFVDSFQEAQQYFYMELFSTLSIGYLAICAFYTVFHMKIYNIYYLASNSQTDEYSLLFSGMLICRLTAPLCLNYLCLVHHDSHIIKQSSQIETSFTTIMGHLDLIPLVNNGLNIFLPLCISAICSAIYFNFGKHVLHSLGFEQFIEDDEMTIDWVQTGRELVKREKGKLIRNFESTTYHEMVSTQHEPKIEEGAKKKQDNKMTTIDLGETSPTSMSSSSSGFSRSSLLPKSDAQESKQLTTANQNPVAYSSTSSQREHLDDNIIEIEFDDREKENQSTKPAGFFDDV